RRGDGCQPVAPAHRARHHGHRDQHDKVQRRQRTAGGEMRDIGRAGAPADVVEDRRGEERRQRDEDGDAAPTEPPSGYGEKPAAAQSRQHRECRGDLGQDHGDRDPVARVLRTQAQGGEEGRLGQVELGRPAAEEERRQEREGAGTAAERLPRHEEREADDPERPAVDPGDRVGQDRDRDEQRASRSGEHEPRKAGGSGRRWGHALWADRGVTRPVGRPCVGMLISSFSITVGPPRTWLWMAVMYSPSIPMKRSCTPERKKSATMIVVVPRGASPMPRNQAKTENTEKRIEKIAMPKPTKVQNRIGALVKAKIAFSAWSISIIRLCLETPRFRAFQV